MKPETQKLLDRTFQFGVDCLRFINALPNMVMFKVPKYQLAKASTSVGLNYEESQAAESRKDFSHKIGIASKEARESHFWLRMIKAISDNNVDYEKLHYLINEALELKKIFASIKLSSQK